MAVSQRRSSCIAPSGVMASSSRALGTCNSSSGLRFAAACLPGGVPYTQAQLSATAGRARREERGAPACVRELHQQRSACCPQCANRVNAWPVAALL